MRPMATRLTAKRWVKRWLPFAVSGVHFIRRLPWRYRSIEHRFARTAHSHDRHGLESRSGPGSSLAETAAIRRELPVLVQELQVISILDVPCGDFHWMKEVALPIARYIGADIMTDQVTKNTVSFANDRRTFMRLDLRQDRLPKVDLILCRDCLVHLSFADIFLALENVKRSNSTYLLATTFPAARENTDIVTGEWRPLNLQLPPFLFPQPLRVLSERCSVEGYADKSLGLWKITDLPPPRT